MFLFVLSAIARFMKLPISETFGFVIALKWDFDS